MTFLYILLFLVCLSTLIMVHEAGHLITAKIFKVYCFEYALGFGPRLFSFKRKKGETRFSLRVVPFGGFVSMYGEADAVPPEYEGVQIDPSRSINNIKHWKRAIIMTAGILMNFVLALVVFFIYEMAFPAYTARTAHITVRKDSIAYEAGLRSQDTVFGPRLSTADGFYIFYDDDATVHYLDSADKTSYFGYNYNQMTIKNTDIADKAVAFERIDIGEITSSGTTLSYEQFFNKEYELDTVDYKISGYFHWYTINNDYKLYYKIVEKTTDTDMYGQPIEGKYITCSIQLDKKLFEEKFCYIPDGAYITLFGKISKETVNGEEIVLFNTAEYETSYPLVNNNLIKENNLNPSSIDFKINVLEVAEEESSRVGEHLVKVNIVSGYLKGNSIDDKKDLGLAMQLDERRNSYSEAVGNTFKDFGNSTTLIFRGLGQLFTREGWKNVGGIIAIGVTTTQTLEQNGFGNFIFMWAMISVNLGIVNLLPFPGLDGWQFLVTIVEGVAHKEIPPKVKNTVSAIGIMLLFVLMVVIVFKDIFTVF